MYWKCYCLLNHAIHIGNICTCDIMKGFIMFNCHLQVHDPGVENKQEEQVNEVANELLSGSIGV